MVREATVRRRKYEASIEGEQIGRKFDALKPLMVEQEGTYLPRIGEVETKVKQICERDGVPTYLVGQYVNFGREIYSLATRFTSLSLAAEAQWTVNKWGSRGLEGNLLLEIARLFGVTPTDPPTPQRIVWFTEEERWARRTAIREENIRPWWSWSSSGKVIDRVADWPDFTTVTKYGLYVVGAGSFSRNLAHVYGGSSSVALVTGATTGNLTEMKLEIPIVFRGLVGLELKFIPAVSYGANKFDMGIEFRNAADIYRARIRYTVTGDRITLETSPDVYQDLSPVLSIKRPVLGSVNAAGDRWGWLKLIADLDNLKYVALHSGGQLDREFRSLTQDMVRVVGGGGGAGAYELLFFGLGITGAGASQTFYTTDWVITNMEKATEDPAYP